MRARLWVCFSGGMYWDSQFGDYLLRRWDEIASHNQHYAIPAYPEIALFKYAKVVWKGKNLKKNGEYQEGTYIVDGKIVRDYKYHTHTLADLFSSGASDEEIEEYVLSSIEKG